MSFLSVVIIVQRNKFTFPFQASLLTLSVIKQRPWCRASRFSLPPLILCDITSVTVALFARFSFTHHFIYCITVRAKNQRGLKALFYPVSEE